MKAVGKAGHAVVFNWGKGTVDLNLRDVPSGIGSGGLWSTVVANKLVYGFNISDSVLGIKAPDKKVIWPVNGIGGWKLAPVEPWPSPVPQPSPVIRPRDSRVLFPVFQSRN